MKKFIIILITFLSLSGFAFGNEGQDDPISTYPNPTVEGFYVNAGDGNVTVNLFSLGGKLLLTKVVTGTEYISVNDIPKGTYIVKLTHNGNTVIKKLVIK
jgi:hypothetical protein